MYLPLSLGRVSRCLLLLLLIRTVPSALGQSLGINSNGAAPHPSAALDVAAPNLGLLIPRVALTATNAAGPITSPATSLLVYNTATTGTAPYEVMPGYYYWSGSQWVRLVSGSLSSGWSLTGNAGTDPATNFIGTTDEKPLVFRVNGQRAGIIPANDYGSLFLGYNTGTFNTGINNSSFGNLSLFKNTVGYSNSAMGYTALFNNTTGFFNTAFGYSSLYANTTGYGNTAIGISTLGLNTTGDLNAAIGAQALYSNFTGHNNTAIGAQALRTNTTGHSNVAIGASALYHNASRHNLVAIGDSALFFNGSEATESWQAVDNTAVGSKALYSNTTGYQNTALGKRSLYSNVIGCYNVAIGWESLFNNTGGLGNIAVGLHALFNNTQGSGNIAIGSRALINNSMGYNNTALGNQAGTTGYDFSNTTTLGFNTTTTTSNQIRLGNSFVTQIGGQVGWSNFSDQRFKRQVQENVAGLDFILKLRPVTYHWDIDHLNRFIHGSAADTLFADSIARSGIASQQRIAYSGFLAQEVEAAARSVGYDFSGVVAPANERTPYSLRYGEFVVPLVKAVQEQQSQLGQQSQVLAGLNARLERPVVRLTSADEWADRVFEPGYRLRPLAEVESYLRQHRHLPGVPSAQVLAQQGVDVSGMLAKQMEKIEELTLYVLELEKKNTELEKTTERLEQLEAIVSGLQRAMQQQTK